MALSPKEPPMSQLRIRLAQLSCQDGDTTSNVTKAVEAIYEAAGKVDLIAFPETFVQGLPTSRTINALAEPLTGRSIKTLSTAARKSGVAVAIGLAEADAGRYFNSAVLLDENGGIRLHYRKTHLNHSDFGVFERGKELSTVLWRGVRIGLLISLDVEFPEPARRLASAGAEVLIVLDGLARPFGYIHRQMVPTRAMENQIFVACVNRVGVATASTFCGESRVCDPTGTTLSVGPRTTEALVDGSIDLEKVGRARADLSYLEVVSSRHYR